MNAVENAFISYSPSRVPTTPEKERQDFFFVTYTGEPDSKDKLARKRIRAQASRASATQRIETTSINKAKKGVTTKTIKKESPSTPRNSTPRSRRPLSDINTNVSPTFVRHLSDQLQMLTHSPGQLAVHSPEQLSPIMQDWECTIPTLMQNYWNRAILEMRRRQITCDLKQLSYYLSQPTLYNEPLMLSCLELLAATAPNSPGSRASLSRNLTNSLWHRVYNEVEMAVAYRESSYSLGPVLLLLSGWELNCGATRQCEYHLRLLSQTIYSTNPYMTDLVQVPFPQEALQHCVPPPCDVFCPGAVGFTFFLNQNLLPSTLMNICASFYNAPDPTNPVHLSNIRRIGLAAISCQPTAQATGSPIRPNQTEARAAVHVRLAAALASTMAQVASDFATLPLDPQQSENVRLWYGETLWLDSESLVGTVYDEILLWSLCVFAAAAWDQPAAPPQRLAIESLLRSMRITTWGGLEEVLCKYFWAGHMPWRLHVVLDGIFA